MAPHVSSGENVLLVWSACQESALLSAVEELREVVGEKGSVQLENVERLLLGKKLLQTRSFFTYTYLIGMRFVLLFAGVHRESSFEVVLAGTVPPSSAIMTDPMLVEIARVLKPGGRLVLREPTCAVGMSVGRT